MFGTKVVIENCRIHHLLHGSFKQQQDAHGITGRWGDVTIRNCDISYVSGDCIQFDPDRKSQGSVVIEDCHLWTGPLPAAALGFRAGERPGENAVDTKTKPDGERCKLTIRNCYMHGWNQPAQIGNVAALNLKENVDAEITHCVFSDNEVAFRVRGPGTRGGARSASTLALCTTRRSPSGPRTRSSSSRSADSRSGKGVAERIRFVPAKSKPAFGSGSTGEIEAPARESLLKNGFPPR